MPYKKIMIIILLTISIFSIWGYKTVQVNRNYPKADKVEHVLGDSFPYQGLNIIVDKKEIITKSEMEKAYPNEMLIVGNMLSDLGDEYNYLLLYLNLKNDTKEDITHQVIQWVVSYGVYGNGASLITDIINSDVSTVEAGEEVRYVLVFNYPAEYGTDLTKYDLKVTAELYPDYEYIILN